MLRKIERLICREYVGGSVDAEHHYITSTAREVYAEVGLMMNDVGKTDSVTSVPDQPAHRHGSLIRDSDHRNSTYAAS